VDLAGLPQLQGADVDDHTRILWIEGNDLFDGAPALLPYEMVHAHYMPHGLAGSGIFLATTNGLSSGNAPAEAICHGLFEVIERDALSRWSRKPPAERKACRQGLPLSGSRLIEELIQRLERSGFAIAIWDIMSDIAVPAFHCVLIDEQEPGGHPGTGTGCHPDKEVALARAIFEAVQVRATYISGGRDDLARREYQTEQLQAFRRLLADDDRGPALRQFSDIPSRTAEFFEDDISWTVEAIDRVGLGAPIVVDLSWDRSDIAVVRVVVPGMEGPPGDNVRPGTPR
jgi:ribosomal protein S12 methylthiotransferase accessory factor